MNKWFTYGEPLHRLREWGVHMKEMDLIDEQTLSPEMARSICATMLVRHNQSPMHCDSGI